MAAELRALADIINAKVTELETLLKEKDLTFPPSSTPFDLESEKARQDGDVMKVVTTLAAAADQLATVSRAPHQPLLEYATAYHVTSALGVALVSNVAEILREGNPSGMHVNDIASKTNVDPKKLARMLRLLATRHMFVEVKPDVFAHNRISSMLDSAKSFEEIQKDPNGKYRGSPSLGALLGGFVDEFFKGGSSTIDVLTSPSTAFSEEAEETPLAHYFKSGKSVWDWYETSGQEHRLERFGLAMNAGRSATTPELVAEGFNWNSLKTKVVVDVGGGIGSTSAVLAEKFLDLNIVVQDRPLVIEDAKKFWKDRNPSAVESGRVLLEPHSFFESQPTRDVGAFILRFILHDWSDKYCRQILKSLHSAVNPETKLVISEIILPYACDAGSTFDDIPGAKRDIPPKPVVANYGVVSSISYLSDIHMYVGFCGQERTIGHFVELLKSGGWKLESVFTPTGSLYSVLVAVPL